MNKSRRRKLTAYLLALAMMFSCFGQSTGIAAASQTESKSEQIQGGESETATGDAVTTATAATIEPTILPTEKPTNNPVTEPSAIPVVTPYPVQDSDTTDFEIGAQNVRCRLTGVYFANKKDYPDAETQVRSKSKNRFSIGGKSVWDLGWIAVEPEDGMTVESIMDSKGTAVGTTTWGEAKKLLSASGMEVSEKAYAAMDGKSDDTTVIYMDRNTYNQYIYNNNIIIRLKNNDGNTESVEIKVQDSHYWINKKLSLGEKIKPLSLPEVKKIYDGREVSKDEFIIRKSSIDGSHEDCLIENGDGSDEYIANRVGIAMVEYTDKKTGMSLEVDVNIKLPDNAVKTDDIIFDDASRVELYGAESGSYLIYPKDEDTLALKKCTLKIKMPENAKVDWSKTKVGGSLLEENGITKVNVGTGYKYDSRETEVKNSLSDRVLTFEFSSDYALSDIFNLVILQDGWSIDYTFTFRGNTYMSMSGGQTYYFTPNQIISIFDLVHIDGASNEQIEKRRQKFIDDVNADIIAVDIPGADLYYENGKFTGKIIFTHTGSYMTIYNKEYKLVMNAGIMDVRLTASGVVKEGADIDIAKTFISGYWENYSIDLGDNPYGFKCDNATHKVTAPDNISDKIEYTIYVKQDERLVAQIRLNVCRKDKFDEDFAEAVTGIKENESMIVDVDEKDASLSEKVVDALQNSGDDKKLTIKNSSSDNDVEWNFDSSDLKEKRTDDIKLNVDVGNGESGVQDMLDKNSSGGLEVKFEDNGDLGGEASVRIYLDEDDKSKLQAESSINLFYYDKDADEMKLEASSLELHNDSVKNKDYIEIPVTHNSEFALSTAASLNAKDVQKPTASPEPTTKPTAKPTTKPTVKPQKKVTVPAMKFVKASAKNKKITVKWSKLSKITGYQLQISDKKNFKKAKTIKYKSKINKVTLSKANGKKLKKKVKYYIRVRAYKTYKDSKGKTKTAYGKYKVLNIKCK